MKRWIAPGLAAMAAIMALATPTARAETDAETTYQTLLAQAKANPAAADWQALRFAYADRPSFRLQGADDGRRAMTVARQTRDWPSLLAAARQLIDSDYVDGSAHLMAFEALTAMNRQDEGAREQAIAVGIFKSIMAGHDGSSPDQAFIVISIAEEYELMAARLRKVNSQTLVGHGGHAYDVLVATNGDGDTKTFYFEVDRVLKAEKREMSPGH